MIPSNILVHIEPMSKTPTIPIIRCNYTAYKSHTKYYTFPDPIANVQQLCHHLFSPLSAVKKWLAQEIAP